MRIKKFLAANLQEGKIMILKELGDDAVILSSRTLKKSPDSAEDIVEIVAAIDDSPMRELRKNLNKQADIPSASKYEDETQINKFMRTVSHIYDEIGTIRDSLANLSEFVRYRYSGSLNETNSFIYKSLLKADFSDEFALMLTGKLSVNGKQYSAPDDALSDALNIISEKIKIMPPVKKLSKPQIVTFTGPSGTGKTTALVKLAIIAKLALDSKVTIISADTQKVGGFEQLQTYASIANITFDTAYNQNEIKKIIFEKSDRDFIFIDTTGLSHNNRQSLDELKNLILSVKPDINYLVVSAVTSLSSFAQILNQFEQTNPTALIITKIDEAAAIGNIVSGLIAKPLPVAYFTSGQKIPDDIEPVTKEYIGRLIFPKLYGIK